MSIRERAFDAPERMSYVNALFIIGSLGTLITPAVLDAWSRLNWSAGRLGLIAGIELAGLALGSLTGLYWQRRWNWRAVTMPSLIVGIAGNVTCLGTDSFLMICAARAAVGMAGGYLCGVYSAYTANIANPVRMIAITTFVQIALEALFLFFAPSLSHLGAGGIFMVMALLFAVLIPLIQWVPQRWPEGGEPQPGTQEHTRSWRGYPILLSFVPFVVVQTGVYTFLGQFGEAAANLNSDEALRLVGISVIFSSLGSILAYGVDGRISLRGAIGGSVLVIGATLAAALHAGNSSGAFLVSISLLQIAWIFLNCMLYAALIQANNLLVAAASTVSCLGASLGTTALGFMFERGGLAGALQLAILSVVCTGILALPFIRHGRVQAAGS
ncbi:MAG TPA: MFS transporter [Steroidobacteraceae bacterium]|nr:MFS transporter [Steroidobacteraceae bacterium]